ncbi:MAG: hypothetical protein O7C75_07675, partial [Verrucomicrobia bacterium]|nr:hypothetical protein [Verrucomicrobiota bacterium]
RALVELHGEDSGKAPLIVFSADASLGNCGVTEFSQALMLTAEATASVLQPEVLKLKSDFKMRVNERNNDRVSSTEAYNLDGTVRSLPMSESLVAGDPEGQDLASLSVGSIRELYEQLIQREVDSVTELRLLYIFDNFSAYAPPIKRWIGGPFLEEFSELNQLPAPSFLLTDQDSWETGGQKDYWQKNPVTFFNYEVPPLDQASCLQWLTEAGHPSSLIDFLMEDSEGMPLQVKELIETPGLLEKKVGEMSESKDLPHPVNARERRWLHAAAMADFVSEESLLLLLGQDEGREALEWLGTSSPFDAITVALSGGVMHIHMRSDIRKLILGQCLAKVPARHREFLEKFDLHAQVAEKVPMSADRDSLRVLAPVQPFNSEILMELFGNDE